MTEIRIYHPDRDRTLKVPAHLWPGRLAAKGWELAPRQAAPEPPPKPDPTPVAPPVVTVDEPPTDERDQLRDEAADLGIEFDGRWGVKRLREAIADARGIEAASTAASTCSVCDAPAVYEIEDAPGEKGNLACEEHRGMWPMSEARPLSSGTAL